MLLNREITRVLIMKQEAHIMPEIANTVGFSRVTIQRASKEAAEPSIPIPEVVPPCSLPPLRL